MNALAWSLVHFVWQGAAIAALAAALMHVFKSPSTRYLVGISALALMLMSFAVTFSMLNGSAGNGAEWSPPDSTAPVAANTWAADDSAPVSFPAAADAGDFLWVARAWLVGVFALALRIVFGLLMLEYLRRRGLVELPAHLVARFRALQKRVGIDRLVRYCESRAVRVPAVIGLIRPIVLIPVRALTGLSTEQLEAVVAHELGHVKRFDVAVNFVQAIAETLFFFHPAVWWLNKRVRALREDCCDDIAVEVTGGSVGYARALAEMASWRDAPHFAMAATGGPIAARVARLLGLREHGAGARTAGAVAASLAVAVAVVAGAISFGVVKPAQAADTMKVPVTVSQPEIAVQPAVRVAVNPVIAQSPPAPPAPASPANPATRAKSPRNAAPAKPAAPARPATAAARGGSYIDQMKDAGFPDLGVDELIAMKVQDITPEYIRGMRATGLDPDANEMIGMKVQGITPEYVQQVRDLGFTPDANEIIAMKVQDITPEYVKGMRALGFKPDANEIIGMKVQDITPEYVQQMRALGFTPDANEVIAMKVQGITPSYVREMRAQGFDVDANELIAMKVQDITPEYRKQMEAAGFKLDANQLIQAKVMGITPEFVAEAAAHGFKNLDINKLIQLKNADIL